MKILIFEGIATSGKTTIENLLVERLELAGQSALLISEHDTLLPILHNTDLASAKRHLKEVVDSALIKQVDVLLFDRLYLTHAFRTGNQISDYANIEEALRKHDAKLIFLTLTEGELSKRLHDALANRDKNWIQYVQSKGSPEQILDYYINQQIRLWELLAKSSIPVITIDAATANPAVIVNQLLGLLQ